MIAGTHMTKAGDGTDVPDGLQGVGTRVERASG
jgi:hypothetical protein